MEFIETAADLRAEDHCRAASGKSRHDPGPAAKLYPMEIHDSVSNMTDAYAQKAVIIAREFNARLDYSENSLMELESILAQLALDLPPGGPSTEELTEMCKMWGCYFGEVVRRRFGGDWSIETYPGKQFATLTLTVSGNKLFPSMKIHRRLTEGEADNIWSFYKMVKAKLEPAQKHKPN
ncbi:MAG: hypothetical protein ACXV5J_06870 [Candidatus Angelobacter sp.]